MLTMFVIPWVPLIQAQGVISSLCCGSRSLRYLASVVLSYIMYESSAFIDFGVLRGGRYGEFGLLDLWCFLSIRFYSSLCSFLLYYHKPILFFAEFELDESLSPILTGQG